MSLMLHSKCMTLRKRRNLFSAQTPSRKKFLVTKCFGQSPSHKYRLQKTKLLVGKYGMETKQSGMYLTISIEINISHYNTILNKCSRKPHTKEPSQLLLKLDI